MAYICIHVYTCMHMYANTYNTCTYGCDTCRYRYIHIHTHTYTYMQWLGQAHLTHVRHATCRYTLDTCTYIHIYTLIHTHTYTYIHIHTPWNSVLGGGFVLLLQQHTTPMHSAAYPDQLGRDSGWGHRVPIVIGGPMGCAGGRLWSPLRVQRARVRQNGCGNGSLIAG